MQTNKIRFFRILKKASKPLKTLKKAVKVHDLNSEKKTRQDKFVFKSFCFYSQLRQHLRGVFYIISSKHFLSPCCYLTISNFFLPFLCSSILSASWVKTLNNAPILFCSISPPWPEFLPLASCCKIS